jgi:hypothetical protein
MDRNLSRASRFLSRANASLQPKKSDRFTRHTYTSIECLRKYFRTYPEESKVIAAQIVKILDTAKTDPIVHIASRRHHPPYIILDFTISHVKIRISVPRHEFDA